MYWSDIWQSVTTITRLDVDDHKDRPVIQEENRLTFQNVKVKLKGDDVYRQGKLCIYKTHISFLPESNDLFKESEITSGIAEKPIGDPFTIPFPDLKNLTYSATLYFFPNYLTWTFTHSSGEQEEEKEMRVEWDAGRVWSIHQAVVKGWKAFGSSSVQPTDVTSSID